MRTRSLGVWALVALVTAVILWLVGWVAVGGATGQFPWGMGPGMMPWFGGAYSAPAMLSMMLSMLLFWIAVILGIAWFIRWLVGASHSGEPDALEVVRRRYARGEINRDEYERLRQDLTRRE